MGRTLEIRPIKGLGGLALCDADTGEILPGQVETAIISKADEISKVVVTFFLARAGGYAHGVVLRSDLEAKSWTL